MPLRGATRHPHPPIDNIASKITVLRYLGDARCDYLGVFTCHATGIKKKAELTREPRPRKEKWVL